jgi:hypothetical protein
MRLLMTWPPADSVAGAGALVALIVAYRLQKIAEADSVHDRTRVFNERFTHDRGAARRCPARGQQMLQPVRAAVPGRLGDAPAVVVLQFHQQSGCYPAGGLAGIPPREAPRHLPEQVLQQDTRLVIRYRGSSGCRFLIVCHDSS